jgi:phosphatidylglycerol:prolipoprotein diacylglycerol transferase
MYPRLLTLGPFHVWGHVLGPYYLYSYGLCLALALGISIYLYARDAGKYIAPKVKLSYDEGFQKAFDLGVWVIICSIIGARVFYVWENHDQFTGSSWVGAFKIWEGGLVYYGGLFGAVVVAYIWFLREKWPLTYCLDLVAPYIPLGQAIGRIGCFLNGCCYGNVDERFGLVFPGGEDQLPHLPTQLWELAGDLTLFFLLLSFRKRTIRFPWLTLSLYGFGYGLLRYVIEFWRRDWNKQYLVIFNSASQAVSGILVVFSFAVICLVLWDFRKVKPAENK